MPPSDTARPATAETVRDPQDVRLGRLERLTNTPSQAAEAPVGLKAHFQELANPPSGPPDPGNDCAAEVGDLNGAVGKGEYQTSSTEQSHRRARWVKFADGLALIAKRLWPADVAALEPRPQGLPDILLFAPKLAQPGWPRFYRAEGTRR